MVYPKTQVVAAFSDDLMNALRVADGADSCENANLIKIIKSQNRTFVSFFVT